MHYYLTTFRLFRKLPTFRFLQRCGIVPTNETSYELEDVEACLTDAADGFIPHVGCSKDGYINEVWYFFHLRGKVENGEFEGTNATFKSTCPSTGIKYPPKLNAEIDSAYHDMFEDRLEDDNEESTRFKEQTVVY
jgi:ribonuclease T2